MLRWVVGATAVVVAAAGFAVPACADREAQSFVSGKGTDTGDCDHAEPCRTFGYAISQTTAGGEVVAVDSSSYGPVTITKSISLIAAKGVHAGISPSSGDAIEVNAGTSGEVVLRNLYLNGAHGGQNGVDYNSASSLVVEDCVVANFANHGIERLANSGDLAQLTVGDTVLRGNGGRVGGALFAQDLGSGFTGVDIDHSRAQLNPFGFEIGDGADATITDSVAARNSAGFVAFGNVRAARMFMERDTAAGNGIGIATFGAQAQAVVSNSTIVDNATGLAADGPLISRANNTLTGNTSDGAFTGTLAAAYRSP